MMKLTIVLTRREGPTALCNKPRTVHSFSEANRVLDEWSYTAPKDGGYDKCDFHITDSESEFEYRGRYDLKHWSHGYPKLKSQVIDFMLEHTDVEPWLGLVREHS